MDANGTWAVSGDAFVELEMTLTSEVRIIKHDENDEFICCQVETFPFDPSTDLPTGVELQDLIDQAIKLDNYLILINLQINLPRWAQQTIAAALVLGAHPHLTKLPSTTEITRKQNLLQNIQSEMSETLPSLQTIVDDEFRVMLLVR